MTKPAKRRLRDFVAPLTRAVVLNRAFDPWRTARVLKSGWFARDYQRFAALSRRPSLMPSMRDVTPMLLDKDDTAGSAGGDYFHQDLWAAKKIFAQRPDTHLDVGSRLDGFVAHVLVFMPVEVIDIRPIRSNVRGLTFTQDDATELAGFSDCSVTSLSCLHAAEHFGLGRYGDPIDPEACFRLMKTLARVLARNGTLYFSVPIGRERVEFNAQRVFSPLTILAELSSLDLVSFSAVGERGELQEDCSVEDYLDVSTCCGLFEFSKP